MRSILVCTIIASAALVAGGAQAAEPAQGVSLQSAEGQAIVRKVVDLSQRLGLPNPFVAPEPVVLDRHGRPLTDPTLADIARSRRVDRVDGRADQVDGRRIDALQWPAKLARGAQKHLMTERTKLLNKLDLDAQTRSRIDQSLSETDRVRLGLS